MQSPRQKSKKSLLNSNNKQLNTYGKIAECFTQYLGRMFQDFSLILTEKLKCQQQKIKHNQQLLRSVANMLEIKEKTSSTSLEEIQSSFNRQKKSITIERRFQDLELEKVLKSFERIEDNIKHLQKSLKMSKLSHSIQDPQIRSNYSNINQIEPFAQDRSSWFGQQKSRISKLTKRINQLARQVSCKQIESQIQNPNSQHDESRFCKSQSLISLSKRRFYPKSCPKINQYGSSILLKKNLSQNQIHYQSNLEENIVSLISTHQSSNYKDQNKMPLINKMKTTINDIVNSVRDLNDFKVIKFFLKKALRQISQRPLKDQILNSTNQYINQEKSRPISNIKGQIYVKKQIVPQYFVSKNLDPLQIHEQQGIYQVQSQMKRNNHKHASNELLLKENYKSPNKQNVNSSVQKASIQKRKYFQRTSNEQKIITMLKRKVKPF